ncbi:hypothetical protein CLU79DRAFT_781219 [Phycomyces nitens]|nr:hypothetical protein CLU79DRAFT_781219 [Phycomyces nitens]
MVDIIDKVKSQYAIWKLEKYTKRRSFMPEYDSKDKEYYNQYYQDGTYHDPTSAPPPKPQASAKRTSSLRAIHRAPSLLSQRATTLFRKTSTASTPPRCSENYNQTAQR